MVKDTTVAIIFISMFIIISIIGGIYVTHRENVIESFCKERGFDDGQLRTKDFMCFDGCFDNVNGAHACNHTYFLKEEVFK